MKALLLENIHDEAVRTLKQAGYEVERVSEALDEDDLISALDGVDLLGIRSRTRVSRRVVEACGDNLTAVHWHEPDGSGHHGPGWCSGLQRPLFQHPFGC